MALEATKIWISMDRAVLREVCAGVLVCVPNRRWGEPGSEYLRAA